MLSGCSEASGRAKQLVAMTHHGTEMGHRPRKARGDILFARYGSTQDLGYSLETLWLPLPLETRQSMGSTKAIVVHEGKAEKRSIESPCVEAGLRGQ